MFGRARFRERIGREKVRIKSRSCLSSLSSKTMMYDKQVLIRNKGNLFFAERRRNIVPERYSDSSYKLLTADRISAICADIKNVVYHCKKARIFLSFAFARFRYFIKLFVLLRYGTLRFLILRSLFSF